MNKLRFLLFLILISCKGKIERIIVLSKETKELEIKEYLGNIVEAKDDYVYLYGVSRPLTRVNIETGRIDTIFFSRERFIFSVKERDNVIYFLTNKRLKRTKDGLTEICNLNIDGYFKFLNDEFIILEDYGAMKDYFSLYNIKTGKRLNSFGDMIEYQDVKFKDKLKYDRFTIPYPEYEWDVKGSILVSYEYFFDRLKAYDIIKGKVIKVFGVKHKDWNPPTVDITGKGKNRVYKIKKTPAAGLVISENYIFLCLEKFWLKEWNINKKEKKLRRLYNKGFFFIDVYRRNDFEYIGSFSPLNEEDFFKDEIYFRLWRVKAEGDTLLIFYLQDNRRELFFRKIKIKIKLNPS